MKKFEFKGFEFRVIERDGNAWFIGKELSDYFGYRKSADMVRVLHAGEYEVIHSDGVSPGQPEGALFAPRGGGNLRQSVTLVTEGGLYHLIDRSTKPEAKEFNRWVNHEVLPTIRKTGGDYNEPGSPVSVAHQLGDVEGMVALLEANQQMLTALAGQLSETKPRATAGYGAEATKGGQTVWDMRYAISEALGIGVQEVHKVLGMCGFYERREGGHFSIRERHRDILFETPVQVGDRTYNSGPPRVRPGKQDEFLNRVREAYAFRFGVVDGTGARS